MASDCPTGAGTRTALDAAMAKAAELGVLQAVAIVDDVGLLASFAKLPELTLALGVSAWRRNRRRRRRHQRQLGPTRTRAWPMTSPSP